MDNTQQPAQPTQPTPSVPTNVPTPVSASAASPMTQADQTAMNQQPQMIVQEKQSSGMSPLLWGLIGLVILAIAGGAGYWYMNRTSSSEIAQISTQTTEQAVPSSSPVTTLNEDLSKIDVPTSTDSDFTALDKDLQSL